MCIICCLKVLQAHQLKLEDIHVVYLPPADARAAFERGAVDAWVIWDPFFAAAEQQLGARILATGQNLVSNHQFYLADRQFSEAHPELLNTVVQQLNTTTQSDSATSSTGGTTLRKNQRVYRSIFCSRSIARMGFGVQNISAQVVQQQQQVADAFYQQKLIPQKIDIQAAILKPTTSTSP